MNHRKHVYYITISDIQRIASERINRNLSDEELDQVTDRMLDKIQLYDPIEEAIDVIAEVS